MTEAQRQIERAAELAKRKGLTIAGYRPASPALLKHPDGSLVLRIEFARRVKEALAVAVEEIKSSRGAVVRERSGQGSLL